MFKKIVTMIIVITLLFSILSTITVYADLAERNESGAPYGDTALENDDLSVIGTDSFGEMLSEVISDESQEQEENNGNNIFSVEIEGNTVRADFETTENAVLYVALFDESDDMIMLSSGRTVVTKEDKEAEVTLDKDVSGESFIVRAFLISEETNIPLCSAFESDMYTSEMQEFLLMTTDDFEDRAVLNFDDDNTNNFAVLSDSTFVLEGEDGVNEVSSVDNDTKTYVIENADETTLSLTQGDIFSYDYEDGSLLIVKVKSIEIDGTTVVITGDDVELEEVFDYVKIDNTGDASDAAFDSSESDEDVTYEGLNESQEENGEDDIASTGVDISGSTGLKFSFRIQSEESESAFSVDGGLDLGAKFSLKAYITLSKQYFELKVDYSGDVMLTFEAENEHSDDETLRWTLGKVYWIPAAGVRIDTTPILVCKISGSIELKASFSGTVGFRFSFQSGFKNLTSLPEWEFKVDIKGSLFIGLKFKATASLPGRVVSASVTGSGGAEAEATLDKAGIDTTLKDSGPIEHDCKICTKGEIHAKFGLSVSIKFFNSNRFSFKRDIFEVKIKLVDFYISVGQDNKVEFGWTLCPHKRYPMTFLILDEYNHIVPDAELSCEYTDADGNRLVRRASTDRDGKATLTLPPGTYTVHISCVGHESRDYIIKVIDESEDRTVKLKYKTTYTPSNGKVINSNRAILTNGNSGGVHYTLYTDGEMVLSGSGGTNPYHNGYYGQEYPWDDYRDRIKSLVIEEGVTEITGNTFRSCSNLESVTIPASIKSIGVESFGDCPKLQKVYISDLAAWCKINFGRSSGSFPEIPTSNPLATAKTLYVNGVPVTNRLVLDDTVTEIYPYAFAGFTPLKSIRIGKNVVGIHGSAFIGCKDLERIEVDEDNSNYSSSADCNAFISNDYLALGCKTTVIPDGVHYIGSYSFVDCPEELVIPDSVNSIDVGAFYNCSNLKRVTISENVTKIPEYAFYECTGLRSVKLPDQLQSIGNYAFYQCRELQSIEFPDSLSAIGYSFSYCEKLTEISIPYGVTSLRGFDHCAGLKKVTIPDSVETISGLGYCTSLEALTIPSSVKSIEDISGCISLTEISIPDSVTNIESATFSGCTGLKTVKLGNGITKVADSLFTGCTGLESIEIPDSVTELERWAFEDCSGLQSVKLGSNVAKLANGVFENCSSLKTIIIPSSTKSIGSGCFTGCYSLSDVYYQGSEEDWQQVNIDMGGWPYQYDPGNQNLKNANIHYNSYPDIDSVSAVTVSTAAAPEPVPAADIPASDQKTEYSIAGTGNDLNLAEDNGSFTRDNIVPGSEALLMMFEGSPETYSAETSPLLYISQATVDADGSVTFDLGNRYKDHDYVAVIFGECSHIAGDWIVTKEATSEESGERVRICELCDEIVEREEIPQTSEKVLLLGDADGDGVITIIDATVIQRMLVELPVVSFIEAAADVTGDGLNIVDATIIQRYLAEIDILYPVGEYIN